MVKEDIAARKRMAAEKDKEKADMEKAERMARLRGKIKVQTSARTKK